MRDPEKDRASHPLIYRLYRRFCEGIYGWAAPVYDLVADLVSFGQWENWLRLVRDEVEGGPILEVGFGTGRLQALLSRRFGGEIYGLELSSDMHRLCRKRMRKQELISHRVRGNGMNLPFENQSFEVVLATFPEEYIVDPRTLKELERVLRPNGKVLLMGRWISLNSSLLGNFFPVFYRKPTEEERKDLISLANNCGLNAKVEDRRLSKVTHHLVHMTKEEGDRSTLEDGFGPKEKEGGK